MLSHELLLLCNVSEYANRLQHVNCLIFDVQTPCVQQTMLPHTRALHAMEDAILKRNLERVERAGTCAVYEEHG